MLLVLILGLLMNAIALPLAAMRVTFLSRAIGHGQPAPDRIKGVTGRLGAATKRQVVEVFGQRKMLRWSVPGTAHFFVMWAFFILATVYLEAYGSLLKLLFTGGEGPLDWAIPIVGHWAILGFLQDFIAVMALFGLVTFYVIRLRNAPKDLGRRSRFFGSHLGPAYFTLFMIFNVIWTMFLFRGASSALGNLPYDNGAFVSIGIGNLLDGLSHSTLEVLEGVGLLLHIGVMLAFLIFVLNSKHLHIFLAPLNVLFGRDPVALGAAKPMMNAGKPLTLDDLEELDEDAKLGVGAAEDFSWKGILDMATCTECGRCQDQCPAWNTEKPLSPKLMMMALRDHTLSKTPYLLADEGKRETMLEGDEALAKEVQRPLIGDTGDDWFYMPEDGSGVIDPDVLWSCVTCGACVQQCPVDIEHVDHIVDMRRYQVLVESNFPAELNGLFKGLENKGNPWNMSSTARLDWAKDLPFDVKVVGEDVESLDEVEWLFWVGCAGAYEDRAKKTTRAVAELLDMAGVSFAVLGNGETCTGDSARRAGNEFVFQSLAAENIATFKETKVKKVVSTCAHCFNTLKNEYSQLGITLEVVHHTQLLNRLVREKKLTPIRTPETSWDGPHLRPITYHDPCYLGRHNQVYEAPRELLNVLPDTKFVEMPRNSERSFCCGAGGARMWMEETIGTRINETRTKEAVATGAEKIAVGCPFCRVMLSDGLTSAQSNGEAREEVEVLDVAQMLLASIKGESKPAVKRAAAASSEAKASSGGGTATATIERDSTDEATKAEPEAGDTTQAEDTVTETEDVGPAAKASAAGSLFDLGGDDSSDEPEKPEASRPETKTEAAPEPVKAAAAGGGSLFDIGGDDSSSEPEAKASGASGAEAESESKAEPAAKAEGSDTDFGGSLFDLGGDDDSSSEPESKVSEPEPEPEAAEPEAKAGEDAAGDSTTDEDVDRTEDDADTDVVPVTAPAATAASGTASTPGTEIPEGGSLFDIEAPAEEEVTKAAPAAETTTEEPEKSEKPEESEDKAGEDAAGDSTTDEDVDRSADDADTDVVPATAPAATAASGTASTPGTEIPEGGSLFDIEAPAEEEVIKAAPAAETTTEEPEKSEESKESEDKAGEDAAGASTTDEDVDRSADDADTDVQPATAPAATAASGTASTPGTEIPEGGSLFDIEAPAEEEVTKAAPAAETTTEEPEKSEESKESEDKAGEDAAGDSTTDEDVDRRADDADTDVQPAEDDADEGSSEEAEPSDDEPITSLSDIKAKYAEGGSADSEDSSTDAGDTADEWADDADDSDDEPESTDAAEDEQDEKPKPVSSDEAHQPKTDSEIKEGGSLFDL